MIQPAIWIIDENVDDVQWYMESLGSLHINVSRVKVFQETGSVMKLLVNRRAVLPKLLLISQRQPMGTGVDLIKWLQHERWLSGIQVLLIADRLTDREKRICEALNITVINEPSSKAEYTAIGQACSKGNYLNR